MDALKGWCMGTLSLKPLVKLMTGAVLFLEAA